MELRRKCGSHIQDWYYNSGKALLVTGARQVGKTHLIRSVLAEMHCDFVEINLIETPAAVSVLQQADNADNLVLGLSTITGKSLQKGKTVIFIDEVQRYSEMITKIKFLVEEGSFRYILSGSLLGIELTGLSSAPVGYLSILKMYPLDFEEFLQTSNIGKEGIHHLRDCFRKRTPVMDAVHTKMMEVFTRYLLVGGMPDAVSVYADTGNLNEVMQVHRDIAELHKMDFTQYEEKNKKLLLTQVYDLVPQALLKQNRRFVITDLKKGLRFERVESTFLWLEKAGVVLPAYNVSEPKIPLMLNEKHSLFKLYHLDVGMLTSAYGMDTKRMLLSDDPHLNAGGIYENAIAQELFAKENALYYYNSNRLGELDFVVTYDGSPLAIEVKSGKDYTIHSAINHCLNNPSFAMKEAIVFSKANLSVKERVTYLPVYMAMFLEQEKQSLILDDVDFKDIRF